MRKKKSNSPRAILMGFLIKSGQVFKTLGKWLAGLIKSVFIGLAAIIRAIAYLIRDVSGALEKFAKVVAILLMSISLSVLAIFAGLYLFTATFGLKESPVFQELRDKIATIYLEEVNEELEELEIELEDKEAL